MEPETNTESGQSQTLVHKKNINHPTNPLTKQIPPLNHPPPQNQNQGSTVATILVEPRTEDVDVGIVTRGSTMIGEYVP